VSDTEARVDAIPCHVGVEPPSFPMTLDPGTGRGGPDPGLGQRVETLFCEVSSGDKNHRDKIGQTNCMYPTYIRNVNTKQHVPVL
jgi:hypothetical protein